MSAIEGGDNSDAEPFGRRDHRSVGRSEREIAIGSDEFGDSHPVAGRNRFCKKVSCGEVAEESHFCVSAEARAEQLPMVNAGARRSERAAWRKS